MPIGLADFVKIPTAFKYVLLFGLLAGATIKIPFSGIINVFDIGVDISIGEIFFAPIAFGLGFIGITATFNQFVILVVLVGLILFMGTMNKS